jgi:replicative DNA helicase
MTVGVAHQVIEIVRKKHGLDPKLLVMDYLQIVPIPGARGKKEAVPQVPNLLRALTLQEKVATAVGVQSSREADRRAIKLPRSDEGEWSSSIEQATDYLLGMWKPSKTEQPDSTVSLNGETHRVTQELFFMQLLKQRNGPAGKIWAMYFQPHLLRLAELDECKERPLIF